MRFNQDFYIVGYDTRLLNVTDTDLLKKPLLNDWNNINIVPVKTHKFEYRLYERWQDVIKFQNSQCSIFNILTQKIDRFKEKTIDNYTTNLCVIDIDDQALKHDNELYNLELDHSSNRYELSNKILRILLQENDTNHQETRITQSSKGYHLIARFNADTFHLLDQKKLKLTEYICDKYKITDNEQKRFDIDILPSHQIKMQNHQCKQCFNYDCSNNNLITIPKNVFEKENIDHSSGTGGFSDVFSKAREYKPRFFDAEKKQFKFIHGAFYKYLEMNGIKPRYKNMYCCVFHNERTPSLSIDYERNIFNCFGCGTKGNLTQFVAKYENITTKEAYKRLIELGLME